MSFAKEAWPFVLPPLLVAIAFFTAGLFGWSVLALTVALLLLLFFRIPKAHSPIDPALVLAPAYGRVTAVDLVEDAALGNGRFHRIVTFLSVLDVHIQRCPVAGQVKVRQFSSGRHVAAFRPAAAAVNESQLSVLEDERGHTIAVRQVVGLLARRIVCYLEEGQRVQRGDSLGLIKFGSRVDLLVPSSHEVLVRPGDKLRAGQTAVARPGARDGS